MRLDRLLVKEKLVVSRQRAKDVIEEGQVYVNGRLVTKASTLIEEGSLLEIRGPVLAYPSRAGLKLEKALNVFQVDVTDLVALDVGASTGGFTSCLLQRGAKMVYALDVGQNQLVDELRCDPRVHVFEQTNIRDVGPEFFSNSIDLVTIDVSFISLEKVFPIICTLLRPGGQIIALVKPQFETGGQGLNKQGVITNKRIHEQFIPNLLNRLQGSDLGLLGFDFSPISGGKGNLEYLAYFKAGCPTQDSIDLVEKIIDLGWKQDFVGGGK